MPHPAPSSASVVASAARGGLVYLRKPASCGKSEALPLLFRSLIPTGPLANPEHPVTCSKSYALGRWRGAMGKVPLVRLAESVTLPSYFGGYDDGAAERTEREAARRAHARLIRTSSWTR